MLLLSFNVRGAEAYRIDGVLWLLPEAIEEEAFTCAAGAGSDHLETGSEAERDAFRQRVYDAALRALQGPGDTYTDPLGVVWRLSTDDPEDD